MTNKEKYLLVKLANEDDNKTDGGEDDPKPDPKDEGKEEESEETGGPGIWDNYWQGLKNSQPESQFGLIGEDGAPTDGAGWDPSQFGADMQGGTVGGVNMPWQNWGALGGAGAGAALGGDHKLISALQGGLGGWGAGNLLQNYDRIGNLEGGMDAAGGAAGTAGSLTPGLAALGGAGALQFLKSDDEEEEEEPVTA